MSVDTKMLPFLKIFTNKSSISSWNPKEVVHFHNTIGNKETPLVKLPGLAKHLGIGSLLVKDESHRFGLNAFKALGASYAMYKQIEINPQIKFFCTESTAFRFNVFEFILDCSDILFGPSPKT